MKRTSKSLFQRREGPATAAGFAGEEHLHVVFGLELFQAAEDLRPHRRIDRVSVDQRFVLHDSLPIRLDIG